MSILSKIKKGVASSGSSRGKILFIKDGSKVRIRFLVDVEDGIEVVIHDSFDRGINALCGEYQGKDCPYCDDDSLRTRDAYVWPVWDHDAKEVKLFVGYANNFNPLPQLVAMYESYGTLTDRDYVIGREGKQTNTKYTVVPMDKVKFRNKNAKPYSKDKMIDILSKAYPFNDDDVDDDQERENTRRKQKSRRKVEEEEDEDDEDEENEYESMKPRELYMECIERGLNVKKKQKKQYYIDILLEDDAADDDEPDEDDWDEDDDDDGEDW